MTTSVRSLCPGRCTCVLLYAAAALLAVIIPLHAQEALPEEQWKLLDTLEAHRLKQADDVFSKKDYRAAAAAYDAFILEFPRSKVIAYALLRKGLATENDGKRFEAIRTYNDILDYFPSALPYSSVALYQLGKCHWDSGDVEKAIVAWLEMARDPDYSKHPLAARAMIALADNAAKQEKTADAVDYYTRAAELACRSDRETSRRAMGPVISHHVRTAPNEGKLRAFYIAVGTFDWNWHAPPKDPVQDRTYWEQVWEQVWKHGDFTPLQKDQKKNYFTYWARTFGTRFPDWDDYQIQSARMQRAADGNDDAYLARLDQQFQQGQKPGDWARLAKWMGILREFPAKLGSYAAMIDYGKISAEDLERFMSALRPDPNQPTPTVGVDIFGKFYATADFQQMDNDAIWRLTRLIYEYMRKPDMGRNTVRKLRFDQMKDDSLSGIVGWLVSRDAIAAREVSARMTDKDRGKKVMLDHFHHHRQIEQGLPLAEDLTRVDHYAKDAWWKKAELLHWSQQYAAAIEAYRTADRPPDSLWRIADCYAALGEAPKAIAQLTEIEGFFADRAPAAALRIAYIYRDLGKRDSYIAGLRAVMKKYPESGESSKAHQELEALGVRIGGGIDAD